MGVSGRCEKGGGAVREVAGATSVVVVMIIGIIIIIINIDCGGYGNAAGKSDVRRFKRYERGQEVGIAGVV